MTAVKAELQIVLEQAVLVLRCSYWFTNTCTVTVVSTRTTEVLVTLTGLLAAALAIVTVGWILSCVYWQRRWVIDVYEVIFNCKQFTRSRNPFNS